MKCPECGKQMEVWDNGSDFTWLSCGEYDGCKDYEVCDLVKIIDILEKKAAVHAEMMVAAIQSSRTIRHGFDYGVGQNPADDDTK